MLPVRFWRWFRPTFNPLGSQRKPGHAPGFNGDLAGNDREWEKSMIPETITQMRTIQCEPRVRKGEGGDIQHAYPASYALAHLALARKALDAGHLDVAGARILAASTLIEGMNDD